MDRRPLGAALLLFTVLVAAAVPRIGGTQVAGQAEAVTIAPPPTVGDCVLSDPASSGASGEVPALSYGSCATPHYGEIVQIYADSLTFPNTQPDEIRAPSATFCEGAASSYLAVDQVLPRYDRGDYQSVSFGPWRPAPVGTVGLIGPSVEQRAVGQDWIACITEGTSPKPAIGTVREAFSGGTLPNSYTLCSDDLVGGRSVDCGSRHRAELFALTGLVDALPAQSVLDISCQDFVRYLTGRKDLKGASGLTIEAKVVYHGVTGHPAPGQTDPIQTSPAEAFCGVSTVGDLALTGSLFAIGEGRLPLS
ncbi:hypothetical protein SAMN04515671_2842 [Nakamurella panacisegetis]|uniref:Septum formation n=1 Tax=Nakamurella panacisegetis TaxID=1090615 RepID=A0A1H0PN73_9ACTN|nr:hypothetical protein [Nakamurella panacisegetis]SDP06240.1 hypothetical protein SAMN04515671_2842 [Nakamurella panacisegetis]